jgi:hypothetical protein
MNHSLSQELYIFFKQNSIQMKKLFQKLIVTGAIIAGSIGAISAQNANVQVIHNCADPAAAAVDVYVDGTLTLPSFAFRTATPFLSLPSGMTYSIAVAPPHSTSVSQAIATFSVGPLSADSSYIVIASGVLDTLNFASNPEELNRSFTLDVIAHALTASPNPANVALGVFHGSTDAPAVDVDLTGGATLVPDIEYGQFQGYLSVPATWYPISIAPTGTSTYVANYTADLSSLADSSVLVLASGFLDSTAGHYGSFELIAVLANGTVINLPLQQQSLVQVIHNAPDPAADTVDVYLDGVRAIPGFAFRTATPFIPVLSNVNHTIAVAPNHSTSVSQALATFNNINLLPDSNYVVTASGVVGTGFAANPEGISTAFTLLVKQGAELHAQTAGNFDFFVIHGSPDAPTVDVRVEQNNALIVTDASYKAQTAYLGVPAGSYVLDVQDSTGTTTLARYDAPLAAFTDSSAVVLASGFLDPAANNNGPAFGLWVALPSGGNLIPLTNATGINNISDKIGLKYYPNPTSGLLNVSFNSPSAATINITDLSGNVVKAMTGNQGNNTLAINVNDLSDGMYIMHLVTSAGSTNEKFTLIK